MADYSINPQFANLSGLQPLQALDLTRGGSLQFQALAPIEVVSSRPELVAQGIAGAVQGIAQGALSGITAKWEKEESLAKEQRKYDRELALEEAKQQTKNKNFIDELKLKTASEHGLEADLPKRMAEIDKAAERLNFVNPSGNVAEKKPAKKPTPAQEPSVSVTQAQEETEKEYKTTEDPRYKAALSEAQAGDLKEQILKVDAETPLPEMQGVVEVLPSETPTLISDKPVSLSLSGLQPQVQQQQPQQPQPSLTGLEPIVTTNAIPSKMVKIPAQPTDPKAPRNLGKDIEFEPEDASIAVDIAGKLSTPYWEVIAVENPRTFKWFLQPKDNNTTVANLQNQAANLNISVERLALDKQKDARDAQKAEIELKNAERLRLKEDKTYLKKIKNNISDATKNIDLIDIAIEKIQNNPELVGVISKYYSDEKKIPLTPVTMEEAAIIAKTWLGYDAPYEKVQKVKDLTASLNSVASNIGWSKFSELKELSSTGSAGVGGFSNEERQSLQQTQGALDAGLSPDLNLDTLYRLKNGAVKILLNAYAEVKPLDKSVKNPISTDIYNSYANKIKEINSALANATEDQKQSQNYKDALKRLESLQRTIEFIDQFSKPLK
jgi:hypothetical protein